MKKYPNQIAIYLQRANTDIIISTGTICVKVCYNFFKVVFFRVRCRLCHMFKILAIDLQTVD